MQKLGELASDPIGDALNYNATQRASTASGTSGYDVLEKLDMLISLLMIIMKNGKEFNIQIGERTFMRILRDMGVVFE